jgi:hypothetical protein
MLHIYIPGSNQTHDQAIWSPRHRAFPVIIATATTIIAPIIMSSVLAFALVKEADKSEILWDIS